MNKIINSDALNALKKIPDSCCHTCITSPPYCGLRDYGALWVNIGDGHTRKTQPDPVAAGLRIESRRMDPGVSETRIPWN